MKKIYLLAAAALLSVGTFAQNTYKFSKKEIAKGKVTSAERVSEESIQFNKLPVQSLVIPSMLQEHQ